MKRNILKNMLGSSSDEMPRHWCLVQCPNGLKRATSTVARLNNGWRRRRHSHNGCSVSKDSCPIPSMPPRDVTPKLFCSVPHCDPEEVTRYKITRLHAFLTRLAYPIFPALIALSTGLRVIPSERKNTHTFNVTKNAIRDICKVAVLSRL